MQESETIYVIEYKGYWYYYIFHIKLLIQPNWHYYTKQYLTFHFLVVRIEQHIYINVEYWYYYIFFINATKSALILPNIKRFHFTQEAYFL